MEDPIHVSLTPDLEAWVQSLVTSGSYRSKSEVVRHALRTLRKREPGMAAILRSAGGVATTSAAAPGPTGPGAGPPAPAPTTDPVVEAARAAEIRELVEPLRKVAGVIREVVLENGCVDPRILIKRRRPAPGAARSFGDSEPKLTSAILVKQLDIRFPGNDFVLSDELHQRVPMLVFFEFEDHLEVYTRPEDVVAVLPL